MKSILKKLSRAVQVVLAAPVQLPAKVLKIVKYIAIGLGILETVVQEKLEDSEPRQEEGGDEAAH